MNANRSKSSAPYQKSAILLGTLFCMAIAAAVLLEGFGAFRDALAEDAMGGTAKGSLTVNGKSSPLSHAYAMAQPNTFEKSKTDIAVLLTEKPLPEGALKDVEEIEDALPKQQAYALFRMDESGKLTYELISHPSLGKNRLMMSDIATKARFTARVFGKDRVEGSVETLKTEEIFEHTYAIKATFSTPVLRAKVPEPLPDAKTGKPLPADGGEPGKAYLAFVKALHARDLAAVRSMAPQDQADMSDEELKEALEFFASITPADITIMRGYIRDDRAALYVEGTVEKEKQFGTIEMKKTGGKWRPLKTGWSNTPPPE